MIGYERRSFRFDRAILAIGATEYHGDHLPYGTDTMVAHQLVKEVAKRIDGLLVLPPIPYGMSLHYAKSPIALTLTSETLTKVLKEVFASLLKHGIRKLLIINGHDGNIAPIEVATREFKSEHPEVRLCVLEAWWTTAKELLPKGTFEVWEGLGHAGEGETSIMLATNSELVSMKHAKGAVPDLPSHIQIKWTFEELTPYGATGDPSRATKEKGEKMMKVLVNHIVSFIKEMDKKDWKYGLIDH
ncbi:MAG: creatininase family protein [Candidatus Bathyarchaeota archaeon]|nr:MAG: creatininase family protein [Candidatus Bathyarchaeota archaeon]